MGCDIHMHVEVRLRASDATWHHWSAPTVRRNYALFAKMAGVRGDEDPIAQPRGLPRDASVVTAWASELYGEDGHTHSYLTNVEIEELRVWWQREHSRDYGTWFENAIMGSAPPEKACEVRLVFWFDN